MKKRFRSRLLPLLLIMVVIVNVITPGLMQPGVVYAAEDPADPQQGTEAPSSIVLGKGTIEINGHLFTNAEFQTFLNNAEIIRVPFEKPSAFALGEYDDLVGNGAGTAGTLTILTGAVVGAFQKLTVMFNLADLAGSSYVAIGTIGGVTLPLAIRFHSDSLEINDILVNSFNRALVDLTNFFVNHKKANPDEEIVNPDADTGSGETTKPGEGTEGGSEAEGEKETVTTNKGNEIDVTPGKNHTTTTENPITGEANSSVDILDQNGNIKTRRWFDENGKAVRDVDYTNHGNPSTHPEWPHQHTWDWSKNPPRQQT